MEDSNSLDLTDGVEDRIHVPFAYTRDHAEWLTADGQANFARGTEASVVQSQEDAYAAMAMKDTLSSPFGLDSARPTLGLSDVRAQPSKKDDGYSTLETEGDLPDTTAIIQTLMLHCDLIMNNQMIYLIVDNRMPADVPHWPAFAAWWASRRCLVGPQEEATDILWVCADATTGLHKVPYYWAGVFVLEAARFLYPAQHFALIDNDCVPVTLFEVQDLLQLARQQHQWVDVIGRARSESSSCAGIGMLLFTEAHLEYNAGLVISIGNRSKHSPLEHDKTASTLAKNLQAGRLALVSRARPPVNPSDTIISGTMFTPFVGIAMQTALDLCMVWSLYGLYMRKHFWPSPVTAPNELGPGSTIKWPRQSHPRALTPAGRERTPWVTSWARATFEQGILSALPMLTGPCTVASLPGEHLFQASALPRNRMRLAIFHAFGKAKVGAQAALRELEQQGWETLPIAILGMPNLPPAWAVETWKPVGGMVESPCAFVSPRSRPPGIAPCLVFKQTPRELERNIYVLLQSNRNASAQLLKSRGHIVLLSRDVHFGGFPTFCWQQRIEYAKNPLQMFVICPESARAAHPRLQENIWQTDKLPNFCLLLIHQLEAPEASSCERLISLTPTPHTPHPVLPATSATEQAATHIPTEACIDDCRLMTLKSVWYVCAQGEMSAKIFHRAKALIHAE